MTEQPLVSIIVPVYNLERYIARCVESITTQSYSNLDIILVNDGSTDESGAICDRLAREDSRIRVIHRDNQGVSVARNTGLAQSRGELVQFIDGDDFIAPECLSTLVESFESDDVDVAVVAFKFHPADGRVLPSPEQNHRFLVSGGEALVDVLYRRKAPALFDSMCRRSILEGVEFPPGVASGEDGYVKFRMLSGARRVAFNSMAGYLYCQSPDSALRSGSVSAGKLRHLEVSWRILEECETRSETVRRSSHFFAFWDAVNSPVLRRGLAYSFPNEFELCRKIIARTSAVVAKDPIVTRGHRLVANMSAMSPRCAAWIVRRIKAACGRGAGPALDRN